MPANVAYSSPRAIAEVVSVASIYIAVSLSAVNSVDASMLFPGSWSSEARATGSGFLVGATVQIALVMVAAFLIGLEDIRKAIAATFARSTRQAWTIVLIATSIHVLTAILLILPQPEQVWQPSMLNLTLSVVPAADGWSQEVLFRGYVLFRLARANVPALAQILLSGILFAAIHIGYAGAGGWAALSPLVGTFMLGCFFAWAVKSGGDSLKPVVWCHVLIIVLLQPWLAFAH